MDQPDHVAAALPRPRRTRRLLTGPLLAPLLLAGCVVHLPARQPPPPLARPAPVAPPAAGPMFFYPERGQPEAVQERDRYDCYRWAVAQSGTDPGMTPVRQVPPPPPPAARAPRPAGADVAAGAAVGAAVGAIAAPPRHAVDGAVLGAIFGAVVGSAAQTQREADWRQSRPLPPPVAAPVPAQDPFRRAMSACMQGRGYRVG